MKNWLVAICIVLALFPACNQTGGGKDYTLSMKVKELPTAAVLFTQGKDSYFYDLKITDSYFLFADDKSDTVIRIYNKDQFAAPVQYACRKFGEKGLWAPILRKEVKAGPDGDMVSAVDNDQYERQLQLGSDNIAVQTTVLPKSVIHSMDYNRIGKELYGSPLIRGKRCPYYYFNPEKEYHWVDAAPDVNAALSSFAAEVYATALCVNEEVGSVVAAYRFTNHLTFYGLDGTLRSTVQVGSKVIKPHTMQVRNGLDIEKSTKCFTYICGTPTHVYCVYDGSQDFSNHSKILVFEWNGKHVATWQADHNVRAIAVDPEERYLLAISARDDGGQDILRYPLNP